MSTFQPSGRVGAAAASAALRLLVLATLGACSQPSMLPSNAGVGREPILPDPTHALLPTVNIATAVGWAAGAMPQAAPGLQVAALASGLNHPRWLHVLPNGDVLVAETNGPPRPDDGKGLKGLAMRVLMKKAGAAVPSPNRIVLLRDADGDGRAETTTVFLEGLNSPFGMALVGDRLYIANTDGVVAFPYRAGQTRIEGGGRLLTDLPAGPINHHWTKSLIASPDGSKLYATVGSNSNVGENGIDAEAGRAAIWEIDIASGSKRLYASGLRNPNGMAWDPAGTLWTVVNERDELGNDLVPDYLTSVKDGGFYGWPYSYFGSHIDTRVRERRPDLLARTLVPDYALGSHVAPLGLAYSGDAGALPARLGGASQGMFIGEHGSWNREPRSGYKVVFVPFGARGPNGPPVDVLTGFVDAEGQAQGRPVGVAFDRRGALLVADDVGNTVWRVTLR